MSEVFCYTTIVADPPWDHSDGTGYSYGERYTNPSGPRFGATRSTKPPYPVLSVEQIARLSIPIAEVASKPTKMRVA